MADDFRNAGRNRRGFNLGALLALGISAFACGGTKPGQGAAGTGGSSGAGGSAVMSPGSGGLGGAGSLPAGSGGTADAGGASGVAASGQGGAAAGGAAGAAGGANGADGGTDAGADALDATFWCGPDQPDGGWSWDGPPPASTQCVRGQEYCSNAKCYDLANQGCSQDPTCRCVDHGYVNCHCTDDGHGAVTHLGCDSI